MNEPCSSCPWRIDSPTEHWHKKHFVDVWNDCQDDGLNVMACHCSTRRDLQYCWGWIRVMGFDAIGVRILVSQGNASVDDVESSSEHELYESFEAMMDAQGAFFCDGLPDRNRMMNVAEKTT